MFPPSWISLLHPHPTHLSHVLIQLYIEENEMHIGLILLSAMIKQYLLHVIILLIYFPPLWSCYHALSLFTMSTCIYLIDICTIGHYIHGTWSVYNSNHEKRRNLENLLCVTLLTFLYFLNNNNENKSNNKDTE